MKFKTILSLSLLLLFQSNTIFAQSIRPKFAKHGMVLQSDANVKIWGWATDSVGGSSAEAWISEGALKAFPAHFDTFSKKIDQLREQYHIPGISICVIEKYKVKFARAFLELLISSKSYPSK